MSVESSLGEMMNSFKVLQLVKKNSRIDSATWIAEAEFGFRYVRDIVDALQHPSRILEVGCGSGILLSMLKEEFPYHEFEGIEPLGGGFSQLEELNSFVRDMGVGIETAPYESFQIKQKYDLIYCVNVFEHVKDWRHFLDWAAASLKKNGQFFVLCPNYNFPYESHFKLPVVGNKKLTYRIFRRYIDRFEESNNVEGLWASLNFVKKSEVKKYVQSHEAGLALDLQDDISIVEEMFDRLNKDSEFRKRQSVVGSIALGMKRIGVFSFLKHFPNFLPYMKLNFVKS
jgi:SAM-dependent methyltransferase